jgi:hypothetical protein
MTIAWDRFELRNRVYVLYVGCLPNYKNLWIISWEAPFIAGKDPDWDPDRQWQAAMVVGKKEYPERCVSGWQDKPLDEYFAFTPTKEASWWLAVLQLERILNSQITGMQLAIAALHQQKL